MITRTFGRLGYNVSEIGYGMWGMSGWAGSDDHRSREALDEAVRLGCTFFDTAWGYGAGHSERILGDVVRAHPD
ncbi:MAG: aldo/keto reductase, partial [Gemmatimonadetes bacterium]|nr:aldo/keto reductase [Gemmatimonadota bacterium]